MTKNLKRFFKGLANKSVFLLIDLEANSPGEGNLTLSDMETIQIGYVIFNSQFRLLKKGSIFVKPTKNPILSPFIKELTGINQEQVDNGVSFERGLKQIMQLFKKYNCEYILSYGNYDMKQLYSDCQINSIAYPFFEGNEWYSEKHINIKNALASKMDTREKGMEKMMVYLGLELEGKHHNGEDDCLNIFRITKDQFLM